MRVQPLCWAILCPDNTINTRFAAEGSAEELPCVYETEPECDAALSFWNGGIGRSKPYRKVALFTPFDECINEDPSREMLEHMAKAVSDSADVWTGFAALDAKVAYKAMVEWKLRQRFV